MHMYKLLTFKVNSYVSPEENKFLKFFESSELEPGTDIRYALDKCSCLVKSSTWHSVS